MIVGVLEVRTVNEKCCIYFFLQISSSEVSFALLLYIVCSFHSVTLTQSDKKTSKQKSISQNKIELNQLKMIK